MKPDGYTDDWTRDKIQLQNIDALNHALVEQINILKQAYERLKQIANARYCGNCDLGYKSDDCTCGNYDLENLTKTL